MNEDEHLAALIAGCRRMDELSQMELYRYFYSYGMGICLRFAHTRESALEMLNDGFLKVFLKIDQYRPEFPFKPWLRKILVHAAIDHYRRYATPATEDPYFGEEPLPIHNEALEQLEYEDLLQVMQALPPAYRMVFNLYVVEGLPHADIAHQLGISIGTSKSNLARAREKIKEVLLQTHDLHLKKKKHG